MWRRFPSDHFSPSAAVARSQGRSLKEQILATRPRSRLHWRPFSLLSPIAQRGFVAITKFIFVRVFHTVLNRPAVAQSPQPRDIRRHALDWITHCPERLERPPINPKRQFLGARLPPPRMRPVINLRRTQRFSAARYESAPNPQLHRTAALGWRRRPVTQVTMVRPFHRGPGFPAHGHGLRCALPSAAQAAIHGTI
jgi:hypothetical protein